MSSRHPDPTQPNRGSTVSGIVPWGLCVVMLRVLRRVRRGSAGQCGAHRSVVCCDVGHRATHSRSHRAGPDRSHRPSRQPRPTTPPRLLAAPSRARPPTCVRTRCWPGLAWPGLGASGCQARPQTHKADITSQIYLSAQRPPRPPHTRAVAPGCGGVAVRAGRLAATWAGLTSAATSTINKRKRRSQK